MNKRNCQRFTKTVNAQYGPREMYLPAIVPANSPFYSHLHLMIEDRIYGEGINQRWIIKL